MQLAFVSLVPRRLISRPLPCCTRPRVPSMGPSIAPASPVRGALIVFEGLDRSGKSTQSALLRSRLSAQGVSVSDCVWRYPDRSSPVGGLLGGVLTSSAAAPPPQALHLLFTANRWERDAALRALLDAGVTVIVDRYAYSGIAYSVGAEGLDMDWCRRREEGLVAADLVLYLRVDPEVAARRGGFGEERYEKVGLQKKVGAVFEELAKSEKGWEVLDAAATQEDVEVEVWTRAQRVLEKVRGTEVRLLSY